MAEMPKKHTLTQIIDSLRVCRDVELQRERHWWKWMLIVSIPLLLIVTLQKAAGGHESLSWWVVVAFAMLLIALRIALVWTYQRRRKHYEERMRFHKQKIDEGYTYLIVENGEQKFFK
jgi:hypothetical protein